MTEQSMIPVAIRIDPPKWSAWRTPEGPWVAHCPPLGLAIECDSVEELQQDAEEATDLLLADLIETGDWMEFFKIARHPLQVFARDDHFYRPDSQPTNSHSLWNSNVGHYRETGGAHLVGPSLLFHRTP